MPKTITLTDWKAATTAISVFRQSSQLKAVTNAFEQYAVNPMKLSLLRDTFGVWDKSPTPPAPAERTTLADARENLRYTLAHASGGAVVRATEVKPVGWTLKAWTRAAYGWTAPVVPTMQQPGLTPSQIARVNEAMRRAKLGAQAAHDAMVEVKRRNNLAGMVLTPAETAYHDYFHDPALVQAVLDRFAILSLAFSRVPTVVDIRNTTFGLDCYAACLRKNLTNRDGKGVLTLTGTVEVFLGRDFFAGGDYVASTSATVGTLVHEFAHGSFGAVNAPKVDANDNWELAPSTDNDDRWASPNNDEQSSTPELDKRLAAKEPQAALANADNYGEFAKQIIIAAQK